LPDTTNQKTKVSESNLSDNDIESKTAEHFKYAIKLKIQVELVTDLKLFKVLSEWIGTRYVFGGNTKKGIDCSGFTQQVMKEVYNIDLHRVVGPQFNQCRAIDRNELRTGDLIFFHTTRAGLSHVGLYIGENKFIHASSSRGVVVDDLNAAYYKNAYRKSGRILPD
jgi:lipoprotein Spr